MSIPHIDYPLPALTTEQMIEVDRLMIEEYHIELIQMMENAGRCLAITARDHFFQGSVEEKRICVLAGTGGNGGGAMVAARRLHNWGAKVEVFMTKNQMTPIPQHQLNILKNMGLPVKEWPPLSSQPTHECDLILDGIIGYSLSGNPRGNAKTMIEWANNHFAPILALDTPSGVSLTTGVHYEPTIRANATLTLALPKVGLFSSTIVPLRGTLFLGDISVPPELYLKPTLEMKVPNIFAANDVVKMS